MKKAFLIISALFMISHLSVSLSCMYRGYKKENNKIYYVELRKNGIEKEMKEVDYNTFEVIESLPHFKLLAKDKKNVYYQGEKIENVNSKTFKIIKEILPRDKGPWKYGCGSSSYIIEDKGNIYELREDFGKYVTM